MSARSTGMSQGGSLLVEGRVPASLFHRRRKSRGQPPGRMMSVMAIYRQLLSSVLELSKVRDGTNTVNTRWSPKFAP
jgi:hypothetical protein